MLTRKQLKASRRRKEIVEAAVEIADAEGIEAVSMRRLAEQLEISAMSIYTYVSDKDELLDLMRDEVHGEMLVPEPVPDGWRPALRQIAERTRDAIQAHPWVLDTPIQRPSWRLGTMRHIDQSIGVVEKMGIDGAAGREVLMAVDDYVLGHCHRARARERASEVLARGEGEQRDLDPEVSAAFENGDLPSLKRMVDRRGKRGPSPGVPPAADFDKGLDWLLEGIAVATGADDEVSGNGHGSGRGR